MPLFDFTTGLPDHHYESSGTYLDNTPERGWGQGTGVYAEHRTGGEAWFRVESESPWSPEVFSFWARSGSSTPRNWTIEGSNDLSSWDVLLEVEDGPRDGQHHHYEIQGSGIYQYFRFLSHINWGGNGTRLYDAKLFSQEYAVAGTLLDETGEPLEGKVVCLTVGDSLATSTIISYAISNPQTGEFVLDAPKGLPVTVISLHPTKNALVFDRVMPEPMP